MNQEKYRYQNLPIPGGGYVTGFVFHEGEDGLLYIRTDIGGVYRYDSGLQRWNSLGDHIGMNDIRETFPSAIAVDPGDSNKLYITSGIYGEPHGLLAVSEDRGEHFQKVELPFMVHGNLNGRGTGKRLVVDPADSRILYYASQEDGLWRSEDCGNEWNKVVSLPEDYLTFAAVLDRGAIVVGSAGVRTKRTKHLRGTGLYVSYDGGGHFEEMWQPEDGEIPGIHLAGLVPQRYHEDEKYLFVTFSVMGYNAYVMENGYSCDGGSVVGGKVVRYPKLTDGRLGQGEDITPVLVKARYDTEDTGSFTINLEEYLDENHILSFGFGGICSSKTLSGLLVVSTLCKEDGDCIYRSYDYGKTWECILYGLEIGKMQFRTSYMKPQFNGGSNLIHWLSDIKIDPFHENILWFNTGTGVFRTQNLTDDVVIFEDWCDGLEETVHLNLYSPTGGDVKLIDILGDLGGFAFTDLDKSCENSFADREGNRYITCLNADCSDENPEIVVVTPRGNWKGATKGGLILSKDQCKSFERLPMPFGLNDKIDRRLHHIEEPNVNSGWVALSPSGRRILWSIGCGNELPSDTVVVSHDGGQTFRKVQIFDGEGKCISDDGSSHFKVFSDRMEEDIFYGFGENGRFYVSHDGGLCFREMELPDEFSKVELGLVDCANKTEIRGEAGRQGIFYMALGEAGLWKLHYDRNRMQVSVKKLSKEGDAIMRLGLGVGAPGADYRKTDKALYVAARIDGVYGFYRSTDDGASYVKLNTESQMFGDINSIEGDSQVYGRFYIGTGSRGVLYGEPEV
ncbi:MAG: endoglucanase [Lachnospiraceae bacterium]